MRSAHSSSHCATSKICGSFYLPKNTNKSDCKGMVEMAMAHGQCQIKLDKHKMSGIALNDTLNVWQLKNSLQIQILFSVLIPSKLKEKRSVVLFPWHFINHTNIQQQRHTQVVKSGDIALYLCFCIAKHFFPTSSHFLCKLNLSNVMTSLLAWETFVRLFDTLPLTV